MIIPSGVPEEEPSLHTEHFTKQQNDHGTVQLFHEDQYHRVAINSMFHLQTVQAMLKCIAV
jgi:hypothetical protein